MNRKAEKPERTTLVLTSELNAWMDGQCASIRQRTGTAMSRSEFLRGLVRGAVEISKLGADFSNCRTEEDIGIVAFLGEGELTSPAA